MAFSPDGRRLAAGGVDNRIRVWQVSAAAKEGTNPLLVSRASPTKGRSSSWPGRPTARLASAAEDRTVKLWNAGRMVERHVLERQSDTPAALAFSPDNESLLVGRWTARSPSTACRPASRSRRRWPWPTMPRSPKNPRSAAAQAGAVVAVAARHPARHGHARQAGRQEPGRDRRGLSSTTPRLTGKLIDGRARDSATAAWIEVTPRPTTCRAAPTSSP